MDLDRPYRHSTAFSLLELLIVLAIMVGMAALTFPRLTRPLADSDAHRAANRLRDEIAECRQAAMTSGEPLFLRLEAGGSEIEWGGWSVLMAGELDGGNASWQPEVTTSADRGDAAGELSAITAPNRLRSYSMPPELVIDSVRWEPMIGQPERSDNENRSPGAGGDSEQAVGGAANPEASEASVGRLDGERWYLPFLPSGRTRSCVIAVRDSVSGSRMGIEIDAVSGMARVVRLPTVDAEAGPVTSEPGTSS